MYADQACFCFLSARIKGLCHHQRIDIVLKVTDCGLKRLPLSCGKTRHKVVNAVALFIVKVTYVRQQSERHRQLVAGEFLVVTTGQVLLYLVAEVRDLKQPRARRTGSSPPAGRLH